MKRRSVGEISGLAGILLPGSIGVWVVARTLAAYWGHDTLASLIVLAIGVALIVGLVELFVRQVRAELIERELRALPASPTEVSIDSASPLVSSWLRARLEQAPTPSFGEPMAPYLTGLLVMLGLLGTLLGLFQTVHGAGHALTSSADVDALRRSLSAPIDGLTRSFGCSAAGISASAMLGLALALVRRREGRVMRAFHAYAAGPLRVLSPLRRQALALERLASSAQQDAGGSNTAHAIESVGLKLETVTNQLITLQQTALKTQERVFTELLGKVHVELAKTAGAAGEALHARVSPLLEQLVTRSSEALTLQSGALAQGAQGMVRALESDALERRKEAAEALLALRTRLDEADHARSARQAEQLASVLELAQKVAHEGERREGALAERWQELTTRFDAQLAAAETRAAEQDEALHGQVSAAREREGDQLAKLDVITVRVGAELERLAGALGAQLEQRQASEQSHDARIERVFAPLEAAATALGQHSADQHGVLVESASRQERALTQLAERVQQSAALLDDAIARQSDGLTGLITRVGTLLPELAEAAQAGATATLGRLQASAEQQAERFAALEEAVTRGRDEHARALAEQLSSHAHDIEQRLTQASGVVQEAAAIWQASSAEMQAVAELFASSVERQREASDAWLESLGEVEGAVERAGRDAARDALNDQLASTQEVFARQLQFQRELFEQLRTLRAREAEHAPARGDEQEPANVSY